MGLLRNQYYWAQVLNQLAEFEPVMGQPIDPGAAKDIREIACEALSKLLDDRELDADLEQAILSANEWRGIIGGMGDTFPTFLSAFMQLESKILADARVNTIVSRDLAREIQLIGPRFGDEGFEHTRDKIEFCRKLACDDRAAEDPRLPLCGRVWRGVKGVAVLGIDLGSPVAAVVMLGPITGGLVGGLIGLSSGYGMDLLSDAVRGRE